MLSSKHVRVFRKTCTTFGKHVRVFQKTSLTFALWKRRNDITKYGKFLQERFDHKSTEDLHQRRLHLPNRDGAKGWGGCTYCNNQTFSPEYCHTEKSVTEQLEEGVRFFFPQISGYAVSGLLPSLHEYIRPIRLSYSQI